MRTITLAVILSMLAGRVMCAENFKDVPKDHWAAESVQIVKDNGVVKGYPDGTLKGDKPVTRYELAVALERMIAFMNESLKLEVDKSRKTKVESQVAPSPQPSPPGEGVSSAQALKAGGYIAADSPLLTEPKKTVSPTELAQALASVASKLIENTIPVPKE